MNEKFILRNDAQPEIIGEGVSRRILAHSAAIMLVEIHFKAGGIGAPHTHPHDQVTYIISGRFRFTNGGETRDVGPGDSIRFAPGIEHGTVCMEDGCLIDVFTPCREDFLPK